MVIKIYAPAPSTSSAVQYNERKVAEEKASVISSSRIADVTDPMKTFIVYENGSLKTEKMSFHASINPSITDKLTDAQVAELVKQWMKKMGYGNQPYILYKHTDTGRVHYHLVSVRVDENGRKIPDFQERKRSQKAMQELSEKFDFEIGKGTTQGKDTKEKKTTNPYEGFDPKAGDFAGQVERIANLAMTYYFKKPEQFDLIMESLGIQVLHQVDGSHAFIGLDPKTHKAVTSPIQDSGIRFPSAESIQKRVDACKGQIKTREKQKVANAVRIALSPKKGIKTELHTLRYLAKWGIYTKFSKTADGKIFGVTFVDMKNKCVFKASDLPGITASQFEEARANIWAKQAKAAKQAATKAESTAGQRAAQTDTPVTAAEICADVASIAITAFGSERSRQNEDEDEDLDKGRSL